MRLGMTWTSFKIFFLINKTETNIRIASEKAVFHTK